MPLAKLKYKQLAESQQPVPAEQHAVRVTSGLKTTHADFWWHQQRGHSLPGTTVNLAMSYELLCSCVFKSREYIASLQPVVDQGWLSEPFHMCLSWSFPCSSSRPPPPNLSFFCCHFCFHEEACMRLLRANAAAKLLVECYCPYDSVLRRVRLGSRWK